MVVPSRTLIPSSEKANGVLLLCFSKTQQPVLRHAFTWNWISFPAILKCIRTHEKDLAVFVFFSVQTFVLNTLCAAWLLLMNSRRLANHSKLSLFTAHWDICEVDALLTFAVCVMVCYGGSRQYSGGSIESIFSTAVRNLGAFSCGQFATVGLQLLSLTLCVLLLKQILPLCVEDVNTAGLLRVCTHQCSDFRFHHSTQICSK